MKLVNYDLHMRLLIIVSGAGSLALALNLANEAQVALLSKEALSKEVLTGSSSPHTQGRIAAVMGATEDSVELHVQDTLMRKAAYATLMFSKLPTLSQAKLAVEWLNKGYNLPAILKNVIT